MKNIMMEVLLNISTKQLEEAVKKLDGSFSDNMEVVLNQLSNYQFREE